jgi:GAF domain-containing protein
MAFNRVRAVLINDIGTFERTHPLVKYLKPTEAHAKSQAELIIPITQNTAGGEHVVFGVLNLEKEKGGYTMRDLDVCQHLARRFCRWWARIQHTIFARSLAQLTRRVALPPSTRQRNSASAVDVSDSRARSGHVHLVGKEWYDDRVPSEFRQALRPVEEALKTAFELTRSHMARVFLIAADGNALVPFCDYPTAKDIHTSEPAEPASFESMSDSGRTACDIALTADRRIIRSPVIMRDRKMRSISAWVAEHGLPCIVGSFDDQHALAGYEGLEAYIRTHEQTRSECCVPLFITGRLIGTLNFQSVHVNAYREQQHLIEAIAELIGLTFAHERRAVEQEIMENHAILAGRKHDLMHAILDLENLAKLQASTLPPEFLQKLEVAKNMIFQIDCRTETKPGSNAVQDRVRGISVAELVREQILHVRGQVVLHPSLDRACKEDVVTEDSIAAFTYALREVLQNAQSGAEDSAGQIAHHRWKLEDGGEKADSVAFGNLVITCERRRLGGRAYAMIRVLNRWMSVGAMNYQQVLYRQPFQASLTDRPHLGAFIAGSLLRSVGGEMSFSMEPVPPEWGKGYLATTQIDLKLQTRKFCG